MGYFLGFIELAEVTVPHSVTKNETDDFPTFFCFTLHIPQLKKKKSFAYDELSVSKQENNLKLKQKVIL